jgi:hypothetical protein
MAKVNLTLLQVDMRALDLLQSAKEADETLMAIQHPPWSYKPISQKMTLNFSSPYDTKKRSHPLPARLRYVSMGRVWDLF